MKKICILLSVLLLCGLFGCQTTEMEQSASQNPARSMTSPSENNPTTNPPTSSAPVTTAPPTTAPATTAPPTTAPATEPPAPTQPPIKQTVTPFNTEYSLPDDINEIHNFGWNVVITDYANGYDRWRYPETVKPAPAVGEVVLSPNVLRIISEHPDDAICYVYIGVTTNRDENGDWLPDYNGLVEILRQRLLDANYVVYDNVQYVCPFNSVGVFMTVGQLKQLHCGDDISVAVFFAAYGNVF